MTRIVQVCLMFNLAPLFTWTCSNEGNCLGSKISHILVFTCEDSLFCWREFLWVHISVLDNSGSLWFSGESIQQFSGASDVPVHSCRSQWGICAAKLWSSPSLDNGKWNAEFLHGTYTLCDLVRIRHCTLEINSWLYWLSKHVSFISMCSMISSFCWYSILPFWSFLHD